VKLGLSLGYWGATPPADLVEQVVEAERLGFDSVWTAEAYGSDAITPLAWVGARTERIKLATGIAQLSARTPAALAMAAMTLDHLSGGRFIVGVGASGPQVVEGWYGMPFPKPLARTREYVAILRKIFARDAPVAFEGEFYALPYPGGSGLGKPLKSTIHPLRTDMPIFLAAEGPKNVAMSAEIADGWLPMFYSPHNDTHFREALAEGFARPGARRTAENFEIVLTVPFVPGDDIEACADLLRPFYALYAGGMGAKGQNFHYDAMARLGYEEVASKVQELYLSGRKQEAAALIPTKLIEQVALIGPIDKIRDELSEWRKSMVTTILVSGPVDLLRTAAEVILAG
jgi:F420-dependent oxidoreductase-like protein